MITPEIYKKILQYALNKAHKNQDAKDIAQEVCIKILMYPPKELNNKLLGVIVDRANRDFYYKKYDGKDLVQENCYEFYDLIAKENLTHNNHPEKLYSIQEDFYHIKNMRIKFKQGPIQTKVFDLIMDEATTIEIAKALGISHNAAGSNVNLVYQKIRNNY
jgi:hypothetical protein